MNKKKQTLEIIEKRKALHEQVGNMTNSDLMAIFAYLYEDAMIDLIMKCDLAEIEHAIEHTKP